MTTIIEPRKVTIDMAEICRVAGVAPGADGRLNLPATQDTQDALQRAAREMLLPWAPGDAPVIVTLTGACPSWAYLAAGHGFHGTAAALYYVAPNCPPMRIWAHGVS